MKPDNPCYKCPDRTIDCHCAGKCRGDRYRKAIEMREREKEERRIENIGIAYTSDTIKRIAEKRRKRNIK